jgi:hypothetical protein
MDNSRNNYMQKDVNIRISNECKSQLDWLKNSIHSQLLTSAFLKSIIFLREII